MTNANVILFRASSTGKIMTDPRSKSEPISETSKAHLIEIYIENVFGRKKDISNKYIEKGLMVEEDSITLYSRLTKTFYKKNSERIFNDYLSGEPDLFDGETIHTSKVIIDCKSSWDIFTFWKAKTSAVDSNYYWQLQSYMALTGAKSARLVYCLINTPQALIMDAKRKLMWQAGVIDDADIDFQKACQALEKNMTYDDIPLSDRMHEIVIERNDADIERLYERIDKARDWMNTNLFKT